MNKKQNSEFFYEIQEIAEKVRISEQNIENEL